jgi:hypothetical protein
MSHSPSPLGRFPFDNSFTFPDRFGHPELPAAHSHFARHPGDSFQPNRPSRRKTQAWTSVEDSRLREAVQRFGTDNWNLVAKCIGTNRTRSQCSQRWQRGLDPRIARTRWTPDEEAKLLKLVAEYGEKSWIRVSQAIGNRSDVQCRYRYHQIQKGHFASEATREESEEAEAAAEEGEKMEESERDNEERERKPKAEEQQDGGFAIEQCRLELGANSMSEIFWMLHQ